MGTEYVKGQLTNDFKTRSAGTLCKTTTSSMVGTTVVPILLLLCDDGRRMCTLTYSV